MKKLYLKHLAIPENEKISDNIFNNRIAISIISILFCLTVMISSAFAFFNFNIKKDFTMQAAEWKIRVEDANKNDFGLDYICPSGVGDEIHKFTIYRDGTAEKGYCVIKITNAADETETYYTDSFEEKINISIQAIAGTSVKFIPRWGKPVNYGVRSVSTGTIYHSFTPPPEETSGEGSSDDSDGDSTAQQSDSVETSTESTENKSVDNISSTAEDNSSPGEGEPSAPESESPAPSKENSAPSTSESSSASNGGESSGSGASQSSGGESSSSSSASSSEGFATSSGNESSSNSSSGEEE